MWFWLYWRAKHPVGVRRSHAWWWVPHFIVTVPSRWGSFCAVEYVPPKRRRWSRDDMVILFRGKYRVVEYTVTKVLWFNTKKQVLNWHTNHVAKDASGNYIATGEKKCNRVHKKENS